MQKYAVSFLLLVTPMLVPARALGQSAPRSGGRTAPKAEEVAHLRKVLGDPRLRADEPRQVIEAIKRAGELGAPELAESLVSLLTFAQTFPEDRTAEETGVVFHTNSMSVGRRYPAVSALFQIGKPALSALVKRIGSSANDEPLARDNAAEAMMLIFREDPQQGVCYLRAAAAKASTPTAVYYLNEAAAYGEKRWVIPVVGSASSCPNN